MNQEFKCVFSLTQMKDEYGCSKGMKVTRRNGPDVECQSLLSHQRCQMLHERLKAEGLEAFDMQDDLLSVPHSVWQKIQYGGLQGLKLLVDGGGSPVEDIDALVERASQQYHGLEDIPYQELSSQIVNYKIRRR